MARTHFRTLIASQRSYATSSSEGATFYFCTDYTERAERERAEKRGPFEQLAIQYNRGGYGAVAAIRWQLINLCNMHAAVTNPALYQQQLCCINQHLEAMVRGEKQLPGFEKNVQELLLEKLEPKLQERYREFFKDVSEGLNRTYGLIHGKNDDRNVQQSWAAQTKNGTCDPQYHRQGMTVGERT